MDRYQKIHDNIRAWYQNYGRKHLPWRVTKDPYHIYISEVMLQQTQVKTVLERYYFPFLEAFPSLTALATAQEQDVLKQWEGLGYYSRARNLHKAAKQANGILPHTYEELLALPGIGKNTAHAVLSFGFKQPVPIMEANVKRILCRFFAKTNPNENELWQLAHDLVDAKDSFDYNQAMMDIGALICTPKAPQCVICPLAGECQGKENALAYPHKKVKVKTPIRKRHIVIWQNKKGEYYLLQRKEAFLGGLYGFMQYENKLKGPKKVGQITQVYSHFKLDAVVYKSQDLSIIPLLCEGKWVAYQDISQYPLSQADKKILKYLEP